MFEVKKYYKDDLGERILASKGTYILFIDMDHLDELNKTKGHPAGDAALAALFSRIEDVIDEDMMLFRTGGDDFTVLTGTNDLARCEAIAQALLARADDDVRYPDGTIKVTACVGIGFIPEDVSDPQVPIQYADQAMVEAKHAGRNTYRVHAAIED